MTFVIVYAVIAVAVAVKLGRMTRDIWEGDAPPTPLDASDWAVVVFIAITLGVIWPFLIPMLGIGLGLKFLINHDRREKVQ